MVQKSWISTVSGGPQAKSFKISAVKRLYANFVWKTPAAAGQVLRIEWHDPSGTLRAVWNDKTIKDDKKGTRLYAWIGPGSRQGQARWLDGGAHRRQHAHRAGQVPHRRVSLPCA